MRALCLLALLRVLHHVRMSDRFAWGRPTEPGKALRQALTSLLYPMAEVQDAPALQRSFIHSRCILSVLRAVEAASRAKPGG